MQTSVQWNGTSIKYVLYCPEIGANALSIFKGKHAQGYPNVITDLPEADVAFEGVKAWVLQGEKHQLAFFEMEPSTRVPVHSHDYDQWGMLIEGKMELTISGETTVCRKGDEYVIPAHAKHHACFPKKSRVMDFFSEKARYKTKMAK